MTSLDYLEVVIGFAVVIVFLIDLFQWVVLPRPARNYMRPSYIVTELGWRTWRWLAQRESRVERREAMLGSFAPMLVIVVLGITVAGLIVGYGLVVYGLRHQVRPEPGNLETAIYFSAVSLTTVGFGDFVPTGLASRILVILEATTGLGTVALVISLLFSLYNAIQRREVQLINLDAIAGAPPSGVTLLERSGELNLPETLVGTFDAWRIWSADVLQSHLAYPVLNYFRSSHDNESWVGGLGAMMDAATLVMTTIESPSYGHAKLMFEVGHHLVEDLAYYFKLPQDPEVGVERSEWEEARQRLAAAGYPLREPEGSWEAFSRIRSRYALALNEMARYWAIPPSQWVGDRSLLRHHAPLPR